MGFIVNTNVKAISSLHRVEPAFNKVQSLNSSSSQSEAIAPRGSTVVNISEQAKKLAELDLNKQVQESSTQQVPQSLKIIG